MQKVPSQTVLRHFPHHIPQVQALAARDPEFRDMCEEMDAAEAALVRIGELPKKDDAARRAECQSWIARLKCEMERSLAETRVVTLRPNYRGDQP